ncbi:MAG: AAA family ATPase, partial [Campylobacterota bacterium]|nr:AAA family ATPase [Campylobacterota bacterium]
ANVPFFYQSGASFVHIYVGMGAKRVRELFAKAKICAPSIVFIDEIDAIGKERSGKNNDERESTLNELLTQMDGFEEDNGVIVMAATNKIEILDDALLRAGRFDRRVFIGLPNVQDRIKILQLYLKGKEYDFDLEQLSRETAGFNSAALSTLINEALLHMIKRDAQCINQDDIEVAKNKIEFGKRDKLLLSVEQKDILAIYQASKSFVTKCPIALFDEGIKKSDMTYASKQQLLDMIKKYLSGSVGIEVIKNEPYAMFESDLTKADEIANDMVEKYKMGRNKESLIDEVRAQLKLELSANKDEILRLKDIMLRDEVVL